MRDPDAAAGSLTVNRRCMTNTDQGGCRTQFQPAPVRSGSLRTYPDGRKVFTCGTCLTERVIAQGSGITSAATKGQSQ